MYLELTFILDVILYIWVTFNLKGINDEEEAGTTAPAVMRMWLKSVPPTTDEWIEVIYEIYYGKVVISHKIQKEKKIHRL